MFTQKCGFSFSKINGADEYVFCFFDITVGEEITNTPKEIKEFSDFFKKVDPYDHPVVAHSRTNFGDQKEVYKPLLGYPTYDGVALHAFLNASFTEVLYWVNQSAAVGRKWVVAFDEIGPNKVGVAPDANDTEHNSIRKTALWGTFMAGGAYVQHFCLYH